MRKLSLVITAFIMLALAFGTFSVYRLPDEIETDIPLVNYQHKGNFDYTAYLKPSHLFGPEPRELPQSVKFPVEYMDRIDLSFSYAFVPDQPVAEISTELEVIASLGDARAIRERIILLPQTIKAGDFSVDFTLLMTDDLAGEIITITAYVSTVAVTDEEPVFEFYSQRLTMQPRGQFLEVALDLKHNEYGRSAGLHFEHRGVFDFEVWLKPDSPFGAISLKPPSEQPLTLKTKGPGETLFVDFVENMDLTFNYELITNKPVSNVSKEATINAVIEDTGIWSRSIVLVPPVKENANISISFPLDLDYFNEILEVISNEIGISVSRPNLIIEAVVHTVAQTEFGEINEVFTQSISTNLWADTFEWAESLEKTQSGVITGRQAIPNPNRFIGMSLAGARILSSASLAVIAVLFGYLTWFNIKFKPATESKESRIEKEIDLIRKKYGARIVAAKNLLHASDEKKIILDSIDDLVKVADELGKPIVYQGADTTTDTHKYYVFDTATQYQYVIQGKTSRNLK